MNKFKLGHILLSLPDCYTVIHPDTTNKSNFFILKGDSIKLQGNAGDGFTSMELTNVIKNNKSINLYCDTIGKILRQIGYYKQGRNYGIIINIINFKDRTTFFKDMLKGENHINDLLANSQFHSQLTAGTSDIPSVGENIYLNKEDMVILIQAFKKSEIVN